MDQNPYATSSTPVIPQNGTDIDSLDVSDRWKQFFKGVQKWGGLQMPLYKALPKGPQRREALKDVKPPIASFALAFVFGFFYYLAKGMWKKGLVLTAIVIVILIVTTFVLYMVGGDTLANATRYLGGVIFGIMAPRDFYAFKVEGDKGWLPTRPF